MVENGIFAIHPLSPPSSPRMSGFHTESDAGWHDHSSKDLGSTADGTMALVHTDMPSLALDMQQRPMLRSHKSYPYPLSTPSRSQQENTPANSSGASPSSAERVGMGIDDVGSEDIPTVTYGGSAPASPMSRLTPTSAHGERDAKEMEQQQQQQQQDLNGLNITSTEANEEDAPKPMTAQEIRNQKRKMKRFRLTHNQTRFLMSEFARQAHPDAAHRERLAREIPGLSPRQVQVWFQNRRAKLKRLTSDDRERMMRSRALPDDFDITQALHSPFGTSHGVAPSMGSSSYTPSFPEGNMIRPLTLDTMRRIPDSSHLSPTGVSPAFGGFAFTPPQSATDTLSPVSADGGFGFSPVDTSPRRGNPFGSMPPQSAYPTSHPHIPRLHLHDRMTRSRSESLSSPLRSTLSYSGSGSDFPGPEPPSPALNSAPLSGPDHGSEPRSPQGLNISYGLGYSYAQMPGFQATAPNRMRSFSTGMPRRIDLTSATSSYQPTSRPGSVHTPQTATYPHYQSSPMGTPTSFNLMSAPHHVTSFQNSYLRQDESEGPEGSHFPNVDSDDSGMPQEGEGLQHQY